VGPRRTGIHALTALSPHPCGSTHSAKPAFSLHPSRDRRRLGGMCLKIKIKSRSKSRSRADQEQINGFPAKAGPTKSAMCSKFTDRSHAPRGNAAPDAPRPADDAHSGLGKWRGASRDACPRGAWERSQIKSRWRADQEQINGFPAKAGPTNSSACNQWDRL